MLSVHPSPLDLSTGHSYKCIDLPQRLECTDLRLQGDRRLLVALRAKQEEVGARERAVDGLYVVVTIPSIEEGCCGWNLL